MSSILQLLVISNNCKIEGNLMENNNCPFCEGTGVKYIENGPDDYFEEKCVCQEEDRDLLVER